MRLIDADALKEHYAWWGDTESGKEQKELFDEIVDLQPTVDSRPMKRGTWDRKDKWTSRCSECKYPVYPKDKTRYCPNCGASMTVIKGSRDDNV